MFKGIARLFVATAAGAGLGAGAALARRHLFGASGLPPVASGFPGVAPTPAATDPPVTPAVATFDPSQAATEMDVADLDAARARLRERAAALRAEMEG